MATFSGLKKLLLLPYFQPSPWVRTFKQRFLKKNLFRFWNRKGTEQLTAVILFSMSQVLYVDIYSNSYIYNVFMILSLWSYIPLEYLSVNTLYLLLGYDACVLARFLCVIKSACVMLAWLCTWYISSYYCCVLECNQWYLKLAAVNMYALKMCVSVYVRAPVCIT